MCMETLATCPSKFEMEERGSYAPRLSREQTDSVFGISANVHSRFRAFRKTGFTFAYRDHKKECQVNIPGPAWSSQGEPI